MLKLVVRGEDAYRAVRRVPVLRKFFVYDVTALSSLRDEGLANAAYKSIFFENSRTSKHTAAKRLVDADDMLIARLAGGGPHVVHDVAVSSGVTSLDLCDALRGAGIAADLFISDKYATVYVQGRRLRKIYDAKGAVLKYQVFNVLADRTTTKFFPMSIALYHMLRLVDGESPPPSTSLREVKLYHPAVLRALREGTMRELDYDVFETALEPRFTCVRAMNILNRRCFPDERLLRAVDNLALSLREGGLLQIGRSEAPGRTDATLYRKEDGRLAWVGDLNAGSELKLLLEQKAAA